MEAIDRSASLIIPSNALVERAGMAIWSYARPLDKGSKILFIAGTGNNGADALVAARSAFLESYNNILVFIPKPCENLQLKALRAMGVGITEDLEKAREFLSSCKVVVDGLCGTGLRGRLEGQYYQIVSMVNKRDTNVFCLSIDLPSGISDKADYQSLFVRADLTVCMGLEKACLLDHHFRFAAGSIVVYNPGFPRSLMGEKDASLLDLASYKVKADKYAFKNKKGHVGFVGGSKAFPGAVILSALSAYHANAGLVSILCDQEQKDLYSPSNPQFIYPGPYAFSGLNCLCVGNGWVGDEDLTPYLKSGLPLVLDAGALRSLGRRDISFDNPTVLTPHPGELKCLMDLEGISTFEAFNQAIQAYVDRTRCILVLKACTTWIYGPTMKPCCLDSPNAQLGVAGSGDVLSGIIGAFIASGYSPYEACTQAIVAHNLSGFDACKLSRAIQ